MEFLVRPHKDGIGIAGKQVNGLGVIKGIKRQKGANQVLTKAVNGRWRQFRLNFGAGMRLR